MPLAVALLCAVIGVADGDTLTVRCDTPADGMVNIRVRLADVDAPERAQPFGERSKQHLAELCHRKQATVTPRVQDRYGRTVASVSCAGVDARVEQVRAGLAWVYDRYSSDQSLYAIQDEARQAGRGLWAARDPVAPWDWRKRGHR